MKSPAELQQVAPKTVLLIVSAVEKVARVDLEIQLARRNEFVRRQTKWLSAATVLQSAFRSRKICIAKHYNYVMSAIPAGLTVGAASAVTEVERPQPLGAGCGYTSYGVVLSHSFWRAWVYSERGGPPLALVGEKKWADGSGTGTLFTASSFALTNLMLGGIC
jgi:hypothetical protein